PSSTTRTGTPGRGHSEGTRTMRTHCSVGARARGGGTPPRTERSLVREPEAASRTRLSRLPPQDQRRVADGVAAVAADERGLGAVDLSRYGKLPSQLPNGFDDLEHPLDVALRELPA